MEPAATAGRAHWYVGPFYRMLMDTFPLYRTGRDLLDVRRLADELGRSNEVVYRWLREGQISNTVARRLVKLASAPENQQAIVAAGGTPPELRDFLPFM